VVGDNDEGGFCAAVGGGGIEEVDCGARGRLPPGRATEPPAPCNIILNIASSRATNHSFN